MDCKSRKFKKVNKILERSISKKYIKSIALPVFSASLFLGTVCYLNSQTYALSVEYNGESIANVSNGKVYEKANHMVMDQLTPNAKSEVQKATSEIKIVPANKHDCCNSPNEVKNKIIEQSQDLFVEACGVYVDEKLVCVCKNQEEAEKLFENAVEDAKTENPGLSIEMVQKVEFQTGFFSYDDIRPSEEIKNRLFSETEKTLKYTVKDGETISDIARKFNISEDEIREQNDISEGEPTAESELTITLKEKTICFRFFKNEKQEKEIPFITEIKENPDQCKSWSKTIQEGENGKETFEYKVEYKNGKEISRTEINHESLKQPANQIKEVGTKEDSKEYLWPVSYTHKITSPFGKRGRSFHQGIDIASSGISGNDILASKSGIVETATQSGKGYGNHIIIKHNDGSETLYAHCKSLNVSKGDKIKQGDVIAKVGSTGDSSGAHLHFEIRIGGSAKNPSDYVK